MQNNVFSISILGDSAFFCVLMLQFLASFHLLEVSANLCHLLGHLGHELGVEVDDVGEEGVLEIHFEGCGNEIITVFFSASFEDMCEEFVQVSGVVDR